MKLTATDFSHPFFNAGNFTGIAVVLVVWDTLFVLGIVLLVYWTECLNPYTVLANLVVYAGLRLTCVTFLASRAPAGLASDASTGCMMVLLPHRAVLGDELSVDTLTEESARFGMRLDGALFTSARLEN